jgi:hypothetical protein
LPVPDDRRLPTQRAPARHPAQIDPRHPGTGLSSDSGSEIKRITAGVKACRWFSLPGLVRRPAFTLLVCLMSNEKEYCLLWLSGHPPYGLAGIKGLRANGPFRPARPGATLFLSVWE